MAQKITHWLIIALILSLGFGQLLRFETNFGAFYLHDILVIVLLLLQGQASQVFSYHLQGLALMGLKLFLLGLALGWIFALLHYPLTQLLIPSLYALRLLAYLTLYFVIKQSKILIPRSYFLISGFITLTIGLAQYFFLPDMRVFQYLGWDDHLSRLTLPHFDSTFTAVMLGLALLSTVRTFPKIWLLTSIFYSAGILLTYSRSVWLSLAITFFVFYRQSKLFLISLFVFLACITFWLPKKFGEGTNLLRTYSISSRVQSDIAYIQRYKWDLLIGRGMNTLILDQDESHATSPNNSYLYLLLTSGIFGLMGWGIFMYSLFRKSSYQPMLTFFFIASLFNNVMFYPFALLWIFLIESTAPNAT